MTFDNKVRYYGDGSQRMTQLDTGSLDDYKELMAQGKMFGSDLTLRELRDSLRYDDIIIAATCVLCVYVRFLSKYSLNTNAYKSNSVQCVCTSCKAGA